MSDPKPNDDHDLDALVRQFETSDLNELHVKTPNFELFLSKNGQAEALWPYSGSKPALPSQPLWSAGRAAPSTAAVTTSALTSVSPGADASPASVPEGFDIVRAPYLGTFYRAPKPGEERFVELDQTVEQGTDLCLVEVMKLFTAVSAQAKGIVRHVYAVDGQMVEEGAPLFALEPVA